MTSFTSLIRADELIRHLEGETDRSWVVVDCRFALADPNAGADAYREGHLPGAIYADLDRDLSAPVTATSGRHPLPAPQEFSEKLSGWGIDETKQIVAYDDSGGPFAARFWWLCRWMGLSQVAVLDGGIAAWRKVGGSLTTDLPPVGNTDWRGTVDDSLWLTSEAIAEQVDAGAITLIDARAAPRFAGEVEPIDQVAGHVPGACNAPFAENLDAAGRFLPPEGLRARFEPIVSGSVESPVVHMCGSGVTACHNLLAMEVAGIPGGRLYAGSWSEWIRDPSRPTATGSG